MQSSESVRFWLFSDAGSRLVMHTSVTEMSRIMVHRRRGYAIAALTDITSDPTGRKISDLARLALVALPNF